MNKFRIFIFVCLAAILFSACKSIPEAPADNPPAEEPPSSPLLSVSAGTPMSAGTAPSPDFSEGIAIDTDPSLYEVPGSQAKNKDQNTAQSDASLKAKTAVQPKLSRPSKPAVQPSDNQGTKSTKSPLSLKPKSAVSSGKTAAPSEKPAASPRKPAASPMLKPVQVKPEPTVTDIQTVLKPSPQTPTAGPPAPDVQAPSVPSVQAPPAPQTPPPVPVKEADTVKQADTRMEKNTSPAGSSSFSTTVRPSPTSSANDSVNASASTAPSSVFEEPEVLLHTDDLSEAAYDGEDNQGESVTEPSRVEEVGLNQSFDIPYEGKNWIFLGEKHQTRPPVVKFLKRSFTGGNTVFSLNAASEGETILHFYKHDLLENAARDEYVLVRVGAVKSQTDVNAAAPASSLEPSEAEKIPLSDTDFQTENTLSAEEMYAQAEKAFNEKKYADALNILDDFFQNFTPADKGFDKAVFLKGRIYESPSDYRNIRTALAEYKKITAFFPESGLYDEARRRITYINRFYMDIR